MSGKIKRIAAHGIFILFGAIVLATWCFPPTVTLQMALWIYFWCVVGIVGIYAACALLMWAVMTLDEDGQS